MGVLDDGRLFEYPNRKKPVEPLRLGPNIDKPDSESPSDKSAATDRQEPSGEKTEGNKLPVSGYKIIEPEPESLPEKFVEVEPQPPIAESSVAKEKKAASEPPIPRPPFLESWIERMRKFAENPTRIYAVGGVGLGILLGVVIAAVFWLTGNDGQYDLGSATSSAAGLKGHLFTKWDKKVEYRLTLEPSNPDQQAGFALAVSNSPRPLSIEIRLQDSKGFVVCAKDIILKYDVRNAAAFAASNPDSEAGVADADKTPGNRLAQEIEEAQLEAQEPERELGKDIFQNQIGKDGQIAAIYAQGEIPCSKKAYRNTISWSFSPNFPSLAEQDELRMRQAEAQTKAARLAAEALASHKKKTPKPSIKLLPFSIEGDDAIVEFDASRGIFETRERNTFLFDKTGGQGADSRWQDYPVSIHYRCDRASNCTITHAGLGALRARRKR